MIRLVAPLIVAASLPAGPALANTNVVYRSPLAPRSAGGASLTPAEVRAVLLSETRANHYRAPTVLLDHFAVFFRSSLRHRTARVRISRAPASSLPLGILKLLAGRARRDVHNIREVAIPGMPLVWVQPGAAGISMYSMVDGQAYGGTTAGLAQCTAHGASVNVWRNNRRRAVIGVVPDTNHTIRVRTRFGTIKTIPVIDGVYTVPGGEHHIYIGGV